jgi:predicted glutamine amidotransferase
MCRFLAYRGQPILLEELIAAPTHSLIHQSLHATEAKTGTNGDGFGVGWYGERGMPGLYREVRPAWSDENLRSICAQVRSGLFFAHVRASTGTATSRANCHPFTAGRFLFMHNGQIGGWGQLRRRIEQMIPDNLYEDRLGTTDSEAILLAAMADGLAEDPIAAIARTLRRIHGLMQAARITEALRFTAALTDGERFWAFRWASDGRPATLYWREDATGLVVVSEPIDDQVADWHAVPGGKCLTVVPGETLRLSCLETAVAQAA